MKGIFRAGPVTPSQNHARLQSEAGFTLTELLIAVAILATLSALVSVSFSSAFRILETVEEDQGRAHLARLSLSLMADELTMSRRQFAAPWIGWNVEQAGQPADVLGFISASHVRYQSNVPESDLTRVLYTREGNRLIRLAVRNLYGLTPESVEQFEVATGVVGFNVRYYDRAALAWVDEWDGQVRNRAPDGVMIEVTLTNARNQPQTYTEWVMVPSQVS